MILTLVRLSLFGTLLLLQDCGPPTATGANANTGPSPWPTDNRSSSQNRIRNGDHKMENREEMNVPKLEFSSDLKGSSLHIEYKVKNVTGNDVFLFNVLYEQDSKGQPVTALQPVYASLRTNGVLHLAKCVPPLPQMKSVEMRRIPYVTKLAAGAEFKESFDLKVPVDEYNPYFFKNQDSKEEVRSANHLVFSIQFIRGSEKLKTNPTLIDGALSVWHPDLFGNIETISSREISLSVNVNKRTDAFEEF